MRKIGCLVRWVLFTLNILVAIGFLISAYSPYISPVSHPLWACAGLFFPFLFLANLLFIFVWVCIKWQYAFFRAGSCCRLEQYLELLSAGIRRETGRRRGN